MLVRDEDDWHARGAVCFASSDGADAGSSSPNSETTTATGKKHSCRITQCCKNGSAGSKKKRFRWRRRCTNEDPSCADASSMKTSRLVALNPQRRRAVKFIFAGMVTCQLLINCDAGSLPSIIGIIRQEYPNLSDIEIGLLGALPYVGLICSAPIASNLLQQSNRQNFWVFGALFFTVMASFLMVLSYPPFVYLLFLSRGLLGFSEAPFVIYGPVWVDEFAKSKYATMWLGILQASSVVGVMIGYLIAGFCSTNWRMGIAGESCLLLLLWLIGLICIPKDLINLRVVNAVDCTGLLENNYENAIPTSNKITQEDIHRLIKSQSTTGTDESILEVSEKPREVNDAERPKSSRATNLEIRSSIRNDFFATSPSGMVSEGLASLAIPAYEGNAKTNKSEKQKILVKIGRAFTSFRSGSTIKNLVSLVTNPTYVLMVISLCSLYYVVTGIQYWSTNYFVEVMGVDRRTVLTAFSATAASAPCLGVISGGLFVDRVLGGYKSNKGRFRAVAFCCVSAVFASISAFVFIMITQSFVWAIAAIWFLLFFGGSILPAGAAILLTSIDPQMRPFASGCSTFLYNVFGFTMGSFLPGVFMQFWGLQIGLKIIFGSSFIGCISLFGALIAIWWTQKLEGKVLACKIERDIELCG